MSWMHWGCWALLRSQWEHPFPLPGEGMHLDPLTISFHHHIELPHLKGPINIFSQPHASHSCKSKRSQQCKGSSRDDPFPFKDCSFSSPMPLISLTNYLASGLGNPLLPHRHRECFPALGHLFCILEKGQGEGFRPSQTTEKQGHNPISMRSSLKWKEDASFLRRDRVPYIFWKTELIREKKICKERWVERYPQCLLFLGPGRVLGLSRAGLCKSWTSTVTMGNLVLPTPSPSWALTSIQELQPALTAAAAQTTGKGHGLKEPARPNKFPDGSSPWGSALCHQPLYLRRDKRKGLLSGQTAALPKHCCHPSAKPLRSWAAAHPAQPLTVIINPGWSHIPSNFLWSALTWQQATVSQVCWVSAWRTPSLHMDQLQDAIPAHGSAGGCHPSMQRSLHFNLQ